MVVLGIIPTLTILTVLILLITFGGYSSSFAWKQAIAPVRTQTIDL